MCKVELPMDLTSQTLLTYLVKQSTFSHPFNAN